MLEPDPYKPPIADSPPMQQTERESLHGIIRQLGRDINFLVLMNLAMVLVTFIAIMTNPTWRVRLSPKGQVRWQEIQDFFQTLFGVPVSW